MSITADILGIVFENGSAVLLARVVGPDNDTPIVQSDLASAEYSAYALDEYDVDSEAAVSGHSAVSVAVATLIFDTLQTDELWGDTDAEGYNFKWVLDVSAAQVFTKAGAAYRIIFTLTPNSGQDILVRFRLGCT